MPTLTNVVNRAPIVTGTANQITSTYTGSPATTATLALASTVVNSTQPLFFAYLSTDKNNVTGDGTVYPIVFDSTTVNQAAAYNTGTGFFTAPITGNYLFSTCVYTQGSFTSTGLTLSLITTSASGSYQLYNETLFGGITPVSLPGTVIAHMTTASTAQVQVVATGGSLDVSLSGSGSPYITYLSALLLPA